MFWHDAKFMVNNLLYSKKNTYFYALILRTNL